MSGGVDSSVTARLLLDKVYSALRILLPGDTHVAHRGTTCLRYSCATGTPATSLARTADASGRRTGRTCSGSAGCSISRVKWCASAYLVCELSVLMACRWTCRASTGTRSLHLALWNGKRVERRTRISGATSTLHIQSWKCGAYAHLER